MAAKAKKDYHALLKDSNVTRLLGQIRNFESKDRYNARYNGTPAGEVLEKLGKAHPGKGGHGYDDSGAYQFVEKTWNGVNQQHFNNTLDFSNSAHQDAAAVALLDNLPKVNGKTPLEHAMAGNYADAIKGAGHRFGWVAAKVNGDKMLNNLNGMKQNQPAQAIQAQRMLQAGRNPQKEQEEDALAKLIRIKEGQLQQPQAQAQPQWGQPGQGVGPMGQGMAWGTVPSGFWNEVEKQEQWAVDPNNPDAIHPALIPGSVQSAEVNPWRIIGARLGNMMGMNGNALLPDTRPGMGIDPEKYGTMTPEEIGKVLGGAGILPGSVRWVQEMRHFNGIRYGDNSQAAAPAETPQPEYDMAAAQEAQGLLGGAGKPQFAQGINDAIHQAAVGGYDDLRG